MRKFPISECPKCGNDEIFVKAKIVGVCNYNYKLDGSNSAYNGEIYDATDMKRTGNYTYCNNCGKRLFKITEDMNI